MIRRFLHGIVTVLCLTASSAYAQARFGLPVDCTPGKDCFIQNYADHDDAKGVFRDYTCGTLGYDGHRGTDIRVHNTERLKGEGVDILAAARGVVVARHYVVTIEKDDFPLLQLVKSGMRENDCGAGLRIDHGNGWHTHYCHMRKGSVTVKNGDRVSAGQVIGKMGETGHSGFPHLHFEIQHYEVPIDPFVGHNTAYHCEPERRYSLWTPEAAAQLAYSPAGVMASGFSAGMPQAREIRRYGARPLVALADMQSLGFWADMYGLRKGDVIRMELAAPDGSALLAKNWAQETDAAIDLLKLAAPPPAKGWVKGVYSATLHIGRGGKPLVRHRWEIALK